MRPAGHRPSPAGTDLDPTDAKHQAIPMPSTAPEAARPQALIFDFGVVLFRWRPAALLARVLPARVADEAAALALVDVFFQGYGGDWGRFDRGTISVPELVTSIAGRTGLGEAEVQAVIAAIPDELAPVAESVALVERLHAAGHPLYFLSNMPAPFADHLERSHAFLRRFRDGVFSARVQLCKPEAAVFDHALMRFGLQAREAVFIDDHAANISAAAALGLHTVHFQSPEQTAKALHALGFAAARA
jgi:HAD superfamily hydrolase (TIGR01509 family)